MLFIYNFHMMFGTLDKIIDYYIGLFGIEEKRAKILKTLKTNALSFDEGILKNIIFLKNFILKEALLNKTQESMVYFYRKFFPVFLEYLEKKFTSFPTNELEDIIHDFITSIFQGKYIEKYRPEKSTLKFYLIKRINWFVLKKIRENKYECIENNKFDFIEITQDSEDPINKILAEETKNTIFKALDFLSTEDKFVLAYRFPLIKEYLEVKIPDDYKVNRKRIQAAKDRYFFAYLYVENGLPSIKDPPANECKNLEEFILYYITPKSNRIQYSAEYIRRIWKVKTGKDISVKIIRDVAKKIYRRSCKN